MVIKTFEVFLDVKRAVDNDDFSIVEGDTGNYIHITLTDTGVPVDLTGCRVMAIFSKSNGTSSQDSAIEGGGITIGGDANNEITIHLFQASFADGVVECEIQVYSGENNTTLITSAKFNFSCRKGILNDDTIESTNEYPLLVSLIDTVDQLGADITAAEAARVVAESERAANEAARDAAEAERIDAEESRAAAEELRADAETVRQETFHISTAAATAAAQAATTAAEAANGAAEDADTAAGRANKAAEAAESVVGGAVPSHAGSHAATGSDPITPESIGAANADHAHGSLTNDGKLGTEANKAVYTGINGMLQADTLPVAAGGTGATTAAAARIELGAQAALGKVAITLPASRWGDNAQTVPAEGVTETNSIIVTPTPASYLAYSIGQVRATEQGANSITFMCETIPETDLTVNILIVG